MKISCKIPTINKNNSFEIYDLQQFIKNNNEKVHFEKAIIILNGLIDDLISITQIPSAAFYIFIENKLVKWAYHGKISPVEIHLNQKNFITKVAKEKKDIYFPLIKNEKKIDENIKSRYTFPLLSRKGILCGVVDLQSDKEKFFDLYIDFYREEIRRAYENILAELKFFNFE
jgi:putative methionine-R-sulfoxide reductase with GAF domain